MMGRQEKLFRNLLFSLFVAGLSFLCAVTLSLVFAAGGFRVTVVAPVVGGIKPGPLEDYRYWPEDTLGLAPATRTGSWGFLAKALL